MARRSNSTSAPSTQAEAPTPVQEDTVSTDTTTLPEVDADGTEVETIDQTDTDGTETTPEGTEPAAEAPAADGEPDLTAFNTALATALAEKDGATGEIAEAHTQAVTKAYRELDGLKAKNAARKIVQDGMREAMDEVDVPLARAFRHIEKVALVAAAGGTKSTSTPRPPADPTEAFVQKVAGLRLAHNLAIDSVPEGVKENWRELVEQAVDAHAEAGSTLVAWITNEADDKGDQPEADAWVLGAAKLALGKAGKVGAARAASTGTGTPYTGERRDIAKHIQSAFADKEVGTFLTIAEIRAAKSDEYGDSLPSAGAISARLFPKSGTATVAGVKPDTNSDGKKGATKVA